MEEPIRHVYVEADCYQCVVRVSSMPWTYADRWVEIEVISNHGTRHEHRWRNRLHNAWAVLRNRYDWTGFKLLTRESALRFRDAVNHAVEDVFPVS
jgi:hypothetical protein